METMLVRAAVGYPLCLLPDIQGGKNNIQGKSLKLSKQQQWEHAVL